MQLPTFNVRIFDIEKAAESDTYCDEVKGLLADHGLVISELSTHRPGHVLGSHPVYGEILDVFLPAAGRGSTTARMAWASDQLLKAARATRRLGLTRHVTMSGGLAWPFLYPYPPRPAGLVEEAFAELAKRWRPILDAFDAAGSTVGFELHPGEDVHDGASFERFLAATGNPAGAGILYDPSHLFLQHIDYGGFIDIYHQRIIAFHVKDAEWNPDPKTGVYAGYVDWMDRAGRFRSPGDGDIDFNLIFSKLDSARLRGLGIAGVGVLSQKPRRRRARRRPVHCRPHHPRAIARVRCRDEGQNSTERNRSILGLS